MRPGANGSENNYIKNYWIAGKAKWGRNQGDKKKKGIRKKIVIGARVKGCVQAIVIVNIAGTGL